MKKAISQAGNAVPGRIKTLGIAAALIASLVSGTASADSCKTVICMYGKLTGNSGGSECSSAEADYFDILMKKHGKINWNSTATARGQFLNSCDGADSAVNKQINDKFGKVRG